VTITLGSTTHGEDGRGFTLCALKIGAPSEGWRHYANTVGPMPVNCRVCIVAIRQAESHAELNAAIEAAQKGITG
jgi:hypothetical protein